MAWEVIGDSARMTEIPHISQMGDEVIVGFRVAELTSYVFSY